MTHFPWKAVQGVKPKAKVIFHHVPTQAHWLRHFRNRRFFFFANIIVTPLPSPRPESASKLSTTKQSMDEETRVPSRSSGSKSLVDDRGVDPLSLHILKRTGTEAQLKFRGTGTVPPGEEGQRSRQGSLSVHPEGTMSENAAAAGVKSIANVGKNILGEVLGNESGHKKYILLRLND